MHADGSIGVEVWCGLGFITVVKGANDGATLGELYPMTVEELDVQAVPLPDASGHDGR